MAVYNWQGMQEGQPASGNIEAQNQAEAMAQLQAQAIVPLQLTLVSGEESTGAPPATAPSNHTHQGSGRDELSDADLKRLKKIKRIKVKPKDLLLFTKKFTTMVKSGLPIIKTLNMLHDQVEHPDFKLIVKQILMDVSGGSTLSEAFGAHPHIFDTVYVNLLKAGESSGKLVTFLEKLVVQIEKAEKIRSKFKSALMYPLILLFVAIGVIAVMMIKVVPVFQQMFSSMGSGAGLPGPTQVIVDISEFVRDPARGGTMTIVLIIAFFVFRYLLRTYPKIKQKFDVFMLKVPVIGSVIKMSTFAKIAMVQGNLNAAGVPVLESLDIVRRTMTNTIYIEALEYVHTGISQGQPLSSLYHSSGVFPQTFWQMLEVGEETGNMDDMFDAVTMFYEEEFDLVVDRMSEMMEPIMIVFMGITIGFIIVAMYMPIFSIGTTVSH
jgi:type IV pilus assembly protein PilC